MSSQRYPEEFKTEAVKQILDHGHSVADVSSRLGVSTHSLYKWVRERQMPLAARTQQLSQSDELRRLKTELKRVTEERDILKKGSSRDVGEVVVDGSEVGRLAVAKQTDPLPLPRHARCYVGRGLLGRPPRRFMPGASRRFAASHPL